jgi:hypothetical protein
MITTDFIRLMIGAPQPFSIKYHVHTLDIQFGAAPHFANEHRSVVYFLRPPWTSSMHGHHVQLLRGDNNVRFDSYFFAKFRIRRPTRRLTEIFFFSMRLLLFCPFMEVLQYYSVQDHQCNDLSKPKGLFIENRSCSKVEAPTTVSLRLCL